MKALAYMMSFGSENHKIAELLIRSLRYFKYDGDILVISESPVAGATVEHLIPDPQTWNGRHDWIANIDLIVKNDWDWYMYLDTDFLALRPLDRIFDSLDPAVFYWCQAATTRFCDYPIQVALTEEQRTTELACNAGIFFWSKGMFHEVQSKWRAKIQELTVTFPERKDANQNSINSLIASKAFPCQPIDRNWVRFPANEKSTPTDPIFNHYAGLSGEERTALMRKDMYALNPLLQEFEWYDEKRNGHPELWEFVRKWLKDNNIQSLLEIGGGPGDIQTCVESYCCVDINERVVEAARSVSNARFIHGDWTKMDSASLGKFDAVMALATMEVACNLQSSYGKFIDNILALNPKFACLSFCRSIERPDDIIEERKSPHPFGKTMYEAYFSRQKIEEYLTRTGLTGKYSLQIVRENPPDTVLLLRLQ